MEQSHTIPITKYISHLKYRQSFTQNVDSIFQDFNAFEPLFEKELTIFSDGFSPFLEFLHFLLWF